MRQYELTTNWGLPKQAWLISRHERERFGKMVRRWKKENPKTTLIQELLIEELIAMHIYSQRLRDNTYFFDGEKVDREQVKDHEVDVESDDLRRKTREFDKYMPLIQRWKTDLLKLAMANNINVNVDGDLMSVVAALDKVGQKSDGNGYRAETRIK